MGKKVLRLKKWGNSRRWRRKQNRKVALKADNIHVMNSVSSFYLLLVSFPSHFTFSSFSFFAHFLLSFPSSKRNSQKQKTKIVISCNSKILKIISSEETTATEKPAKRCSFKTELMSCHNPYNVSHCHKFLDSHRPTPSTCYCFTFFHAIKDGKFSFSFFFVTWKFSSRSVDFWDL